MRIAKIVIKLIKQKLKRDSLLENNLLNASSYKLDSVFAIYLNFGLRAEATKSAMRLKKIIKEEKKIVVPNIIV